MPLKWTDYLDRLNDAAIDPNEYAAPHLCLAYRQDIKLAVKLFRRLHNNMDNQAKRIARLNVFLEKKTGEVYRLENEVDKRDREIDRLNAKINKQAIQIERLKLINEG